MREESNAIDALNTLTEYKPDLIVSDVRMPELNGFDFLHRLRQFRKNSEISFVFVTALDDNDSRNASQELRATDYLTKPFDEDEVVRILSKYANSG